MKATLEGPVELWRFEVFADIAVWEPRPDLQALCMAAQDSGALNDVTIDAVVPGLSSRAQQNLLRYVRYLQLIDRTGALTDVGRRCASKGDAPSWEQGAYSLLVAAHPLFGSQVLAFKRTPTDGYDRDFNNLVPIPNWLKADRQRVFTSVFDETSQFSIGAFSSAARQDPVCRSWELPPGRLRWEIDLVTGENKWIVVGAVPTAKNTQHFSCPPGSAPPSELLGLFNAWEPRWDPRLGRVLIPYDGQVEAGGHESFLRTRKYPRVHVGRFGSFDDVEVQDVPVGPATDNDARTWATAIVIARREAADSYVAPAQWRMEWAEVIEGTPLAGRAGAAPDVARLESVDGKPVSLRTRWLLTAGADMELGA